MKNLSKLLIISLLFVLIMSDVTVVANASGGSFIVMDTNSGRVLYEDNYKEKKPIASLTKIATCITALKYVPLEDVVEIKDEWSGIEGSSMYLKSGEKFTVKELLYGLMLRSGNDAATAIKGYAECKGIDFIKCMNEMARSVGACDSEFVNPHGLDHPTHLSTAYDVALLCRYGMNDPTFSKIVSTKKITIGQGESTRVLINKNKLLSRYPYADGIKTGYTKKSGRCLASSANKNGFRLVCVVLNHSSTYETTEKLFDDCYAKYENVLLQSSEEAVGYYEKNGKKVPCGVANDMYYPLTHEEKAQIIKKVYITYDGGLPIKSDVPTGVIEFYLEKQLLFSQKLYSIMA